MQAYAEGLAILKAKPEFRLDLHQITEIWRFGSVVRSWLLDLTSDALAKNPDLHGIEPYVAIPAKVAGRCKRRLMRTCQRPS